MPLTVLAIEKPARITVFPRLGFDTMTSRRLWSLVLATALAAAGAPDARAAAAADVELLGESVVARGLAGSEAPVGGLSGLAYDPQAGRYYAVSDDRSQFGPARLYELEIEVDTAAARLGAVRVLRSIALERADGTPFPFDSIDPESLARTAAGTWVVSSEGRAEKGIAPALFEFDAAGGWVGEWRLPKALRPRPGRGVRNNLALESLTVTPDRRWLFTASENALLQDGPAATAALGSPSRLIRFDARRRRVAAMYLYRTEPLAAAPRGSEFAVNGLVDLLALDDDRLLALERSFTVGRGNVIRLFEVGLAGATNVRRVRSLEHRRGVTPVAKRLLADLGELGCEPDNVEAMTFGPPLADGRRTLLMLADDNFNPASQKSQLLLLAVDPDR